MLIPIQLFSHFNRCLYKLKISIMAQSETKPKWQTHFTFHTIKGEKPIYIEKDDLFTWHDLLFELQDHTNFLWNFIEVAINMRKVVYDLQTKLVDIDIRKEDFCLILKKPTFESQKQKVDYQASMDKQRKLCMNDLRQKSQIQEFARLTSLVQQNQKYLALLNSLTCKYSKLECLVSIEQYQDDKCKVLAYLESKQAAKKVAYIMKSFERNYLTKFLNSNSMQQVKKWIQQNKINERAYRAIIQKIYNEDYKFREYQPRHRQFVESLFIGRPFPTQNQDSDQDQDPTLKKQLKEMIERVNNKKKLLIKKQKKEEFIKILMSKGASSKSAAQALFQSCNDHKKALEIVSGGLVSDVQNLYFTMKKSGRIYLILSFFAQPCFDTIRKQLSGQKDKATLFVEWVARSNTNNEPFVYLLNRYKDYVISMLSGVISLIHLQKLVGEIQQEPQLSTAQQDKLKKQIEELIDLSLVNGLKRAGGEKRLVQAAVKASGNDLSQVQKYLALGGINRSYDFCPTDSKSEQLYLTKKFKNDGVLLHSLRNQNDKNLWLLKLSEQQPMLYEMIVRNKRYFDKLVASK